MTSPSDAASLPNSIPELQTLLEGYQTDLAALDAEQKRLFAAEDPARGVFFASEIHQNRQQKNQLQVQIQFAQIRLNRLRMEAEPF